MPRGDIFLLHRPFQTRRRGCVQTKTSEGGRIGMRADYNYFAPTGGRYQTVFRGTLPRRYSIRRSQRGNNSATPYTFPLPLWLRPSHLLIVRGNCEANRIRRSRWDNALPTKYDYCQSTYTSTATCFATTKKQRHVSASLLSQLLFSAKFRLQPTSNYCRLSPVANFRTTTLVPFRAVLAERTPRQSYV